MHRILEEQRRRNRACRDSWVLYATHRQKVMDLLAERSEDDGGRLCVFGAGNCNDMDLNRLAERFHEIALVDLDGEALVAGVAAQRVARRERIQVHGGVDVTGIGEWLSRWTPASPPDDEALRLWIDRAQRASPGTILPPQDVTASVCLL